MVLKVQAILLRMKKKMFIRDNFSRSYVYSNVCIIWHEFTYAIILLMNP